MIEGIAVQQPLPGTDKAPRPVTFGHVADVHLGLRQFRGDVQVKRLEDFARAWIKACNHLASECEFVLLCGDLYDSNRPSEFARSAAVSGLRLLKEAGVPVFAIWGNHDGLDRDGLSPLHRLEEEGYLHVVDGGHYMHMKSGLGIYIYGLPWQGAGTRRALDGITTPTGQYPSILMAHCGLSGLTPILLPETVDPHLFTEMGFQYVALGHVHRPYMDGLVFMPGSLETCKRDEAFYPDRGYIIATMDFNNPSNLTTKLHRPLRREYRSSNIELPSGKVLHSVGVHDWGQEPIVVSVRFSGAIPPEFNFDEAKQNYYIPDALHHHFINATTRIQDEKGEVSTELSASEIEAVVLEQELGDLAPLGMQVMAALARGLEPGAIAKMIEEGP